MHMSWWAGGLTAVVLLAGGAYGQKPVGPAPEDVLKAALEAQARGDVEGMLAQYALELYAPEAVTVSRGLFAMVAQKISIENFELTVRAVNIGEGERAALVRATMSYVLNAPGYRAATTEGVLASLVKPGEVWKLVVVNPDPLLDEELHAPPAGGEGATAKAAGARPAGPVMDIKEVNSRIDTAMKTFKIDGLKTATDYTFTGIGSVPGVGDAVASVYQVINTLGNAGGTVKDIWNNGFTRAGFLKAGTVALGVAQILTEPIPGLDGLTDVVASHMEQVAQNAQIRRGLEKIRPYLREATAQYHPKLLFLPERLFKYPAGTLKATEGGEDGNPLGEVALGAVFQSPSAMGRTIPFILAGQVVVPEDAADVAEQLGGVHTLSGWSIPLDLTPMIDSPMTGGNPVLQSFRVNRPVAGAPPLVVYTATCMRGRQTTR